jgi:hypothetical protein
MNILDLPPELGSISEPTLGSKSVILMTDLPPEILMIFFEFLHPIDGFYLASSCKQLASCFLKIEKLPNDDIVKGLSEYLYRWCSGCLMYSERKLPTRFCENCFWERFCIVCSKLRGKLDLRFYNWRNYDNIVTLQACKEKCCNLTRCYLCQQLKPTKDAHYAVLWDETHGAILCEECDEDLKCDGSARWCMADDMSEEYLNHSTFRYIISLDCITGWFR